MSVEPAKPQTSYQTMACAIRALSMDAVEHAQSGHPGMPMGMADVATVLYKDFLKFNPQDPDWPNRDRFILSAGHGSMLLYSLLYLTGTTGITLEDIKKFRQLHSPTAGHPEYGYMPGIETTTGPLGQGLANSVGMALGERILAAKFGNIIDHYTYVIAGDGCLMEGISHEAISMAGHLKLGKLIVLFDDNHISIDGPTDLSVSDDQLKRFEASHWHTQAIDGHDYQAIHAALKAAKEDPRPSLIACRTQIAYGAPTKAGTAAAHGSPLGTEEIKGTRQFLNWPHEPFEIPEDNLEAWRQIGQNNQAAFNEWQQTYKALPTDLQQEFSRRLAGELPQDWQQGLNQLCENFITEQPSLATRQTSQLCLDALAPVLPELIGGSADLTGSNNTRAKGMQGIHAPTYEGQYIFYGVREHGMGAVMNGLSLYGGIIPYGGTFLVFSDYMRPAIRLSALMDQRVIYVLTHDSIGLGEDGPTHQPVEHLASLRAIPNLLVFRPADGIETAECWALALQHPTTPSALALSRQNLPTLRQDYKENLSAKGAYVIKESVLNRQVTLLASGSEVALAINAQQQLEAQGIGTAVVSMPCWELFEQQSDEYKSAVLGTKTLRIGIEAASGFGWDRYLPDQSCFIGMKTFGASGKAKDLYEYFGITAANVVETVLQKLS